MGRSAGPFTKNARGSGELRYREIEPKRLKVLRQRYGHRVRVSRKDYELKYCSAIEFQGKPVAGLCCPGEHEIYIDASNEADIPETLLHELMHAEISEAGLRQMESWSSDTEEVLCELVAKWVSHSFKLQIRKSPA